MRSEAEKSTASFLSGEETIFAVGVCWKNGIFSDEIPAARPHQSESFKSEQIFIRWLRLGSIETQNYSYLLFQAWLRSLKNF